MDRWFTLGFIAGAGAVSLWLYRKLSEDPWRTNGEVRADHPAP